MKKIIFISMAAIAMLSGCKDNTNTNGPSQRLDEIVYNWRAEGDGSTFFVEHDTNSREIFRKDIIVTPEGEFYTPTMDVLHMKTWTLDASTMTALNNNIVSKGSATVSGTLLQTQYTISYSPGFTPSAVTIQPKSANAAALSWIDNVTSSSFRVTFISVPVLGTNNISFYWFAYK